MKKIFVTLLSVLLLVGCAANDANTATPTTKPTEVEAVKGNYSDEMKIENPIDLSEEDGADSVEREGDHEGSMYFQHPDFYNMESTDTLTILPKFKTLQQSSEWSCGVDSALMVLDYFGKLGEHTEETLAKFRTNELEPGATSLESMVKIFEAVGGFKINSTYDYTEEEKYEAITLDMVRNYLSNGIPVMVAWNDWGGHWQTIIGYDDMGTETTQDDVVIVADSYDTTDHNQDGYGIYPAERFYYNWTMYDFFTANYGVDERDLLFIAVEPIAE